MVSINQADFLQSLCEKTWRGEVRWIDCDAELSGMPEWLAAQREHCLSAYRYAVLGDHVGAINGGPELLFVTSDGNTLYDETNCHAESKALLWMLADYACCSSRQGAPCEVVKYGEVGPFGHPVT